MEIYLDTASIDDIRAAARFGVVSGVTTNPTLISKEHGVTYKQRVIEICEVIDGPISAECVAHGRRDRLRGARAASWHPNVVVKDRDRRRGAGGDPSLQPRGHPDQHDADLQPAQALLAALAGAAFLSPFVGRLDDVTTDGMALVRQCVEIVDRHGFASRVLAASLRHPMHVLEAALAGAHIATIPPALLTQMLKHPLTDAGIAKFLEDAKKAGIEKAG